MCARNSVILNAKPRDRPVFEPKEMYEATIRAALEEISGQTAAIRLKGKTTAQRRALAAVRVAVRNLDLDAFAERDETSIARFWNLQTTTLLLRVWDSPAFDMRIRATIGNAMADLADVVESPSPIINALGRFLPRRAVLCDACIELGFGELRHGIFMLHSSLRHYRQSTFLQCLPTKAPTRNK